MDEIGKILEINPNLVDSINSISTAIDGIADAAERTASKYKAAFDAMSGDTSALLDRINGMNTLLKTMGVDMTQPLNKGLNETTTAANQAADAITQAASAVGEFAPQSANIAQLTAQIKTMKESLTKGEGISPASTEQQVVDDLAAYKQALKEKMTSTAEADAQILKSKQAAAAEESRMNSQILAEMRALNTQKLRLLTEQLNMDAKANSGNNTAQSKAYYDALVDSLEKVRAELNYLYQQYPALAAASKQAFDLAEMKAYSQYSEKAAKDYARWWEEAMSRRESAEKRVSTQAAPASGNQLANDIQQLELLMNRYQAASNTFKQYDNALPHLNSDSDVQRYLDAQQQVAAYMADIERKIVTMLEGNSQLANSTEFLTSKTRILLETKEKVAAVSIPKTDAYNEDAKGIDNVKNKLKDLLIYLSEYKGVADARNNPAFAKTTMNEFKEITAFYNGMPSKFTAQILALCDVINQLDVSQEKATNTFRNYISTLDGTSLAAQSSKAELQRMGDYYREMEANIQREQQAYSKLEAELQRVQAARRKAEERGYNTSGNDAEADYYDKILQREQQISREMENIKSHNSAIREDEDAILRTKEKEIEAARKIAKEEREAYNKTTKGAIESARGANTYQQRAAAIKNLEAAIKSLDTTDKNYKKNLNALTREYQKLLFQQKAVEERMRGMQSAQKSLISSVSQLKNMLVGVFSIQSIQGYVNKLIEVRGEFELQNVALRAILQNKDEADMLFQRVTELATKSPFTIRQLTKYTKQLAAYQVESSKLYDTTKRLADVSAGLGVDMQRIILAFGQVKAANYLRATEVRQFTEAGINMLGELAKYYSEIEQRQISVADVQEMVTKRMVEFGDVEEVFNRLTSAGGIFYNMQEKQAETLTGMMSNLKDSIDIMLNQIGLSQQDNIKAAIQWVRNLLANWQEVMFYLKQIVIAFGAYKAVTLAARLGTLTFGNSVAWASKGLLGMKDVTLAQVLALKVHSKTARVAGTANIFLAKSIAGVQAALSALLPLLAVSAITAIIVSIEELIRNTTRARRELEALGKEVDRTLKEDTGDLNTRIERYKELIKQFNAAAVGSKAQAQAVNALNSEYGDYLPALVTEATTYAELANNIDSVTEALKKKAKMASYEKVSSQYLEEEVGLADTYAEKWKDTTFMLSSDYSSTNLNMSAFKADYETMFKLFDAIEKKMEEVKRKLSSSELSEIAEQFIKIEDKAAIRSMSNAGDSRGLASSMLEYAEELWHIKEKELLVQEKINEAYGDGAEALEYQNRKAALEAKRDSDLSDADLKMKFATNYDREEYKQKIRDDYESALLDLDFEFNLISKAALDEAKSKVGQWGNETVHDINEKFKEVALADGFDMDAINRVWITREKATKGMSTYEKDLKANYEQQCDIIAQQTRYKRLGLAYDAASLQIAEDRKKLDEMMARILGISLQKTSNKTDKEKLDIITKMRKEYQQNLKLMDKEHAISFTAKQFENNDLYKWLLNKKVITKDIEFNADNTVAMLEKLSKVVDAQTKKQIQETIAQLKNEDVIINIKANLEDAKTEIDRLFDEMELGNEMKKLGIDREFTSAMFGINAKTLDEVEKELERIKDEYAAKNNGLGEDELKTFQKYQDKIDEERKKRLKDQLNTYSAYLKKEYSEAVKIKLKEAKALADIAELETKGLSASLADIMRKNVKEETAKASDKNTWEQFQNSDAYIMMFDNLENISTGALEVVVKDLRNMQNSLKNLDPTQLREIQSRINEIEDTLASRNGWGKAWRDFKTYKDEVTKAAGSFKNVGAMEEKLTSEIYTKEKTLENMKTARQLLTGIIEDKAQGQALDIKSLEINGHILDLTKATDKELADELSTAERNITTEEGFLEKLKERQKIFTNFRKSARNLADTWKNVMDVVSDAYDSVKKVLEATEAISDEDPASNYVQMGEEIMTMVGNMILYTIQTQAATVAADGLGVALNAAMSPIGWILLSMQAIASIISAIVGGEKKAFENDMNRRKKAIENLQKAYENLSDAIEDTYDLSNLKAYNKEARKTLELTIANAEASIALYKARKNGEKKYESEINDLNEAIADAKESLKELDENFTEALGGFGSKSNTKSAAEEFVSTWVDAFKEAGDGLAGLEEQMDEFVENAVKKQVLLRLSKKYVEPLLTAFDQMFAESSPGGEVMTKEELDAWKRLYKENSEAFDEKAKAYMEAIGVTGGTNKEGLDGLTKGIQGVTEDTAEVVAAITESIRFFVADTNVLLHNFELHLVAPEDMANPWYEQIKSQTNYLRQIRDSIESVVTTAGLNKVLRVQMV